ncbi:hypothetical protein PENTCL1PPCAC_17123, partial [Pristionchus entomophagus]
LFSHMLEIRRCISILFILLIAVAASPPQRHNETASSQKPVKAHSETTAIDEPPNEARVKMVQFKWDSVEKVYVVAMWLFAATVFKLVFNNKSFTRFFPESSLLIIVGLIIGYFLLISNVDHLQFTLDGHAFFLYLLPPIIFDAGYFMPNRAFFSNWDSILVFAVVGTIFNTLTIGGSLLALSYSGLFTVPFNACEILLFSSLISAVDPVAVIAVFEEIHVNDFIFVNVFGEALFNDGVTVVLYELFKQFSAVDRILPIDVAAGAGSFFVVSLGGLVIGLLFALFVAFLTKHSHEAVVLAPVFIFLVPYLGYLTAEMLSLSPIIAIAVCGMAMKQYVKGNVTATAANSVKYFTKMLAQSSETAIFMFLGLSTIAFGHKWDTLFVVATVAFCILFRTIGVVAQCFLLNKFRGKKFTKVDQFILSYGGLRGAIAYGLAVSMPDSIAAKQMFVTTTIVVIFFTVFLQGSTIRPLVHFLEIELKKETQMTMAESVYSKYSDYIISGIEDIAGQKGHSSLVRDFERFNNKVLGPLLMRDHARTPNFDATKIVRAYAKIILAEAMVETTAPSRKGSKKSGVHPMSECMCTFTRNGQHIPDCPHHGVNMDILYARFGKMLDEKMDALRQELKQGGGSSSNGDVDIFDDYMEQLKHAPSIKNLNHPALAATRSDAIMRNPAVVLRTNLRDTPRRCRTEGGLCDLDTPS